MESSTSSVEHLFETVSRQSRGPVDQGSTEVGEHTRASRVDFQNWSGNIEQREGEEGNE